MKNTDILSKENSVRSASSAFGRFSAKSNIGQREGDNYQSKSNQSHNVNIPESHDILLLNQYAKSNNNIPDKISAVNTNSLDDCSNPGNIGPTIATPNQNTEKLINQSAMTESRAESNFFTANNSSISMSNFQYI